jgi:hypothetical protein
MKKSFLILKLGAVLIIAYLLSGCGLIQPSTTIEPTQISVEVTRIAPQTVVVTQIIVVTAIPEQFPIFVYPYNGDALDYEGAYMFKVMPIEGALGYEWKFFQNGSIVWDGGMTGNEYAIFEENLGHAKFVLGEVVVSVRAYMGTYYTDATTITILLRPRK